MRFGLQRHLSVDNDPVVTLDDRRNVRLSIRPRPSRSLSMTTVRERMQGAHNEDNRRNQEQSCKRKQNNECDANNERGAKGAGEVRAASCRPVCLHLE